MKSFEASTSSLKMKIFSEGNFIQNFFHERLIFNVWDLPYIPYSWERYYYDKIRPIWKDENKKIRESIPRTFCDVSDLIERVNFQFVKSFYELEYINGNTDYENSGDGRVKFGKWLKDAYYYITIERPLLEKKSMSSYPDLGGWEGFRSSLEKLPPDKNGIVAYKFIGNGKTYEENYAEVDMINSIITKKDSGVLNGVIKYRDYFWD